MKFNCTQVELKAHLSLVSRAVPVRPTHPILGNVLIVAKDNKITLTGFDLSLGIKSVFSAEVEEDGVITLPAKLFTDIIGKLPEGEINISCDSDDDNPFVFIDSLSGRFQLRGVTGDEYPELAVVKPEQSCILPIADIVDGLKVANFASKDDTKQTLTGVNFTIKTTEIVCASTDGHRLGVIILNPDDELSSLNDDVTVTIPAIAIKEVENVIKNNKSVEELNLQIGNSQVFFEVGSTQVFSRILDGTYPNYSGLIPSAFDGVMTIDRVAVVNSLERLSVLTDQKNSMIKFSLDEDGHLTISVEARELGNAKEIIKADISKTIQIGFNVKYLLEGLKTMDSKEVNFNYNQPTQPVVINPLGSLKMTYLIMPVQLKD